METIFLTTTPLFRQGMTGITTMAGLQAQLLTIWTAVPAMNTADMGIINFTASTYTAPKIWEIMPILT